MRFKVFCEDPTGVVTELELGWHAIGRLEKKHAETPSPMTKCPGRQGGVYNEGTGRCDIYKKLRYVCAQVEFIEGGGWRLREVRRRGLVVIH